MNVKFLESDPVILLSKDNGNNLQEHVTATHGLLHFLFQYGEICRSEDVFNHSGTHEKDGWFIERLQSASGAIVSGGLLAGGFRQALLNRFSAVSLTIENTWNELMAFFRQ